jgi:hypothetical protein
MTATNTPAAKSRQRTVAFGTSVALTTGALTLAILAVPSVAAGSDTSNIHGFTANNIGQNVWYDNGSAGGAHSGTPSDVALKVVRDGTALDFTLTGSGGPVQAFVAASANGYRLDAFVRLDGAKNVRGTRFTGPIGTTDVAAGSHMFPSGFTITGTFPNVPVGTHKVTLTDLLVDSNGGSSSDPVGSFGGTPMGFDAIYNSGTTFDTVVTNPTDWPVSVLIDKTAPAVKVTTPKKATLGKSWKTVKGTAKDSGSGVKSVTVTASGSAMPKKKTVKASLSGSKFTAKIGKVTKGKLKVTVKAVDKAGNSKSITVKQKIKK